MNETSNSPAAPTATPATTQPPKKGSGVVGFVFVLLIVIGIVVSCNSKSDSSSSSTSTSAPAAAAAPVVADTSYTVTYKVTGTAGAVDLTMSDEDGDTSQQSKVAVPVTRTLRNMHEGDFLYISAQNQGESGSVICSIEVDGVPVKTATSSGAYVISTCSGRL